MSSHFQLMRDLIRCCLFFDQLEGSLNWGSTRTLHRLNFLLIGYLLKGISKIPEILFLLNNPHQSIQMGEMGTQNLPTNAFITWRTNIFS